LLVGPPHDKCGDIIGTRGWINVPTNAFFPEEYTIHLPGSSDPIHVKRPKVGNGYTEEAAEVSRCIREGREPEPTGEQGMRDIIIIDAIYRAIKQRRAVEIKY